MICQDSEELADRFFHETHNIEKLLYFMVLKNTVFMKKYGKKWLINWGNEAAKKWCI